MYRVIVGLLTLVAFVESSTLAYAQEFRCKRYCDCEDNCCYGYDDTCWPRNPVCDHLFRLRRNLRNHGIEGRFLLSQIYQGVSSGGLSEEFRYGRYGQYDFDFNLGRLIGLHDWELTTIVEHRFAQQVNQFTGSAVPVALPLGLPDPNTTDLAVTEFRLNRKIGDAELFIGKTRTLRYDNNEFASGNGTQTFMNSALNYNPVLTRTVPYSTVGVGLDVYRNCERIFTFAVLDSENRPTTSGLSDLFENGAVIMTQLRMPVTLFGRRGHQAFGATYSSATYNSLFQSGRIDFPNTAITPQSDSWSLTWNADHYIWQDPCDCRRGWGVFGRAGISDGNPNPVEWSLSFGIGGHSNLRGCKDDTFGIGWYYLGISDEFGPAVASVLGSGQGMEMYYEFQFFSFFTLAVDLQVIEPTTPGLDTAVVPGFRGRVQF